MRPLDITLLAFICLAVQVPLHGAKAQEQKITRIQMTIDELTAQGIAVRGTRARPFPNSCQSSGNAKLSVSNQLLEHFKTRGFTLESLCLGLSSNVRFDPETGRQLPLALCLKSVATRLNKSFRSIFRPASAMPSPTWNATTSSTRGGETGLIDAT
jgi:hypothetical protein